MKLNGDELERYARHIVLRDFGGVGQQKLKAAKVLVIGAGGLGAPVIQYLAAAGIGTLGIVDDDMVSTSNLQRQIIHRTQDVDLPKAESAKRFAGDLNPNVAVNLHPLRLTAENADQIISQYDLVCDGSDNFDTRYLAADICEKLQKTLVSAAVGQFDGSITTLKPFEENEAGEFFPRYRDIFPKKPADGIVPSCEQAGILGALTGIIGSMQAIEAIKEITGTGTSLAGRLILYDALEMRFQEIRYRRQG